MARYGSGEILARVVQLANPELGAEVHAVHGLIPLKGNSHQILLSEMSLPGIKVLIEKLLPKILSRLEKENRSKRRCKVAFVQRKYALTSSVLVQFLYATYN